MEEKKQMSLEEVLNVTINTLKGIMVPIEYAEQIGHPILGCIANLRLCTEAIEREKVAAEPEPVEDNVIEL